jgi:hypothetical protein
MSDEQRNRRSQFNKLRATTDGFLFLRILNDLYQNSQTLTHAAGGLPGHPLQIRMEVQRDIGAALGADDGADESTSPQAGIIYL